jgi:hypothetical protein
VAKSADLGCRSQWQVLFELKECSVRPLQNFQIGALQPMSSAKAASLFSRCWPEILRLGGGEGAAHPARSFNSFCAYCRAASSGTPVSLPFKLRRLSPRTMARRYAPCVVQRSRATPIALRSMAVPSTRSASLLCREIPAAGGTGFVNTAGHRCRQSARILSIHGGHGDCRAVGRPESGRGDRVSISAIVMRPVPEASPRRACAMRLPHRTRTHKNVSGVTELSCLCAREG